MNDIVVGVLGWMGLIGFTAWIYLFVKMLVKRDMTTEIKNFSHTSTLDDTESIEYKHTVMASDE